MNRCFTFQIVCSALGEDVEEAFSNVMDSFRADLSSAMGGDIEYTVQEVDTPMCTNQTAEA